MLEVGEQFKILNSIMDNSHEKMKLNPPPKKKNVSVKQISGTKQTQGKVKHRLKGRNIFGMSCEQEQVGVIQ